LEALNILGSVGAKVATNGFDVDFRETVCAPRPLEELF
jgi:hypothetical protein